jgi:hypothetical protein
MAAREGQGLQIAVIIFAMLTIGLAITTYMFYAQAATAQKEREAARTAKAQTDLENNKYLYRMRAMQHVLGLKNVTMQEVDLQKGKAGGDDPEVQEILTQFNSDMAAVGEQAAEGTARSYGTVVKNLLAALQRKNASVADANQQTRQSQTDKAAVEARELARANTAEASLTKVQSDAEAERAKHGENLKTIQSTGDKLLAEQTGLATKTKAEVEKANKDRETSIAEARQLKNANSVLKDKVDELQKKDQIDQFAKPDGKIVWVNQQQRLAWIDLGRADGLERQMSFAVYAQGTTSIASSKSKARIEVIQLTSDHMAEARIVEDKIADLIQPGDVVFTPSWSPGERTHFALSGKMDINGDRIDDYDLVRSVITVNGGEIDAELKPNGARSGPGMSVNTRYFVMGEPPDVDSATDANLLANALKAFSDMDAERERHGVQKISPKELLAMMGWKADERTLPLAGSRGGAFRTPGAGKAQPAGTASPGTGTLPPATDAAPPPATTPTTDPFGAPPAGATPMPTRPATEVDPFAVPK